MPLAEALEVTPGVTAVIGGGGKTTLLRKLGESLGAQGHKVILCTSTKIRAFDGLRGGDLPNLEEVHQFLEAAPLIWVASPAGCTKWGPPRLPIEALANAAEYVLVEADGSQGLPMKAHRSFEPVIPEEAQQTILVMGATGFGRRIADAAHCSSMYALRAGCGEDALITPEIAARVLQAENLHDRVFVNQAETEAHLEAARSLAQRLREPVCAGALLSTGRNGEICLLS